MAGDYHPDDFANAAAARRSANAIREYWLGKGVKVKVWIERAKGRRTGEHLYVVKSEGIPGMGTSA